MSENVRGDQMSVESPQSSQVPNPDEIFVTNQISNEAYALNSGQYSRSNQTFNSIPTHNPSQEAHDSSVSRNVLNNSVTSGNSPSLNLGRMPHGLVDWLNVRIQQDVPQIREAPRNTSLPISKLNYLCSLAEETVERYRSLYFANFHDRWPIIHSPTYEEDEEAPELLLPSILMIGAASIYEGGILTPGTIYTDDKPGFFCHFIRAITLQLGLLKPEELYFSIPDTIALWNAGGIHRWEARQMNEPKSRSYRSINVMLEGIALGGIEFPQNESMLEDIQICLWAMQSEILQLLKQGQPGMRNEISLSIQRQSLKRQMEALKRGFSNLSAKLSCPNVFDQADQSPVCYYYGLEDHDKPGWQDIVSRRINCFIFDTSILHNLMNLQVFTETQTIRMLAKDLALSDEVRGVFGKIYSEPHTRRVAAARAWTQEPSSRRALWHATEILLSHNALNQTPSLANFIPEPISYIALASAALVIWTHCMYGQEACNDLLPASMLPHEVSMSIELTKLSEVMNGSLYDEKGKEVWIEGGAYFRASIENVQLCSCNVGILIDKLRAHIPRGWEIMDEIAPNIFGKLDGQEAAQMAS
ncbi:hypothetical protein H4I96_10526 [Botrytis cinerea]